MEIFATNGHFIRADLINVLYPESLKEDLTYKVLDYIPELGVVVGSREVRKENKIFKNIILF
jgi:hypothetical protein